MANVQKLTVTERNVTYTANVFANYSEATAGDWVTVKSPATVANTAPAGRNTGKANHCCAAMLSLNGYTKQTVAQAYGYGQVCKVWPHKVARWLNESRAKQLGNNVAVAQVKQGGKHGPAYRVVIVPRDSLGDSLPSYLAQ